MLSIRGEKKVEREEKDKDKNGVLSVRLPKSPQAQAKTRRIEVQGA